MEPGSHYRHVPDRQAEYLGSFYVHHRGSHKMTRMIVTDEHLFVLSGNEIVRYRFAQSVTRHFIKTGDFRYSSL